MNRFNPLSPITPISVVLTHHDLLLELIKRDFIGRYRGSFLGIVWSLFNPLLMLTIYTIVFSVAFKARWGTADESKATFALVLFSGIIVHSLFAECLNRAPTLILSHANYVKKVVFPLEILPWMALGSALLHFIVSLAVLLIFSIVVGMQLHWGMIAIPLLILPLLLTILGLSWLLASLGVYLRDLSQGIGMITTVAMFLAPVFYKLEALPPMFQKAITLNPITPPIMQIRDVMFWGKSVNWQLWSVCLMISLFVFYAGFWWFQKTRKGFADVI